MHACDALTTSPALCITGMHRSATSLTAHWLSVCGLAVDDGRRLGAGPSNRGGHFEDRDFSDLHRDALLALRPDSKGWIIRTPLHERLPEWFDDAARELLAQRNGKGRPWGWKDPRTSLFLHEWKRLAPHLKAVLLWRPRVEVTRSLIRRAAVTGHPVNAIDAESGAACWDVYNHQILSYRKAWPDDTILIEASALLAWDTSILDLIRARLGIELVGAPITAVYQDGLLSVPPHLSGRDLAEPRSRLDDLEVDLRGHSDCRRDGP